MVILSEFGAAIYALMSRADFKDDMTKNLEESFSKYTKDKAVAIDWKSLQNEVIIVPSQNNCFYQLSAIFHEQPVLEKSSVSNWPCILVDCFAMANEVLTQPSSANHDSMHRRLPMYAHTNDIFKPPRRPVILVVR
jgi:hypothetical protein